MPAAHAVHAETPVGTLYEPAAQAVHTAARLAVATLLYMPTAQATGWAAAPAHTSPGKHAAQVPPVPAQPPELEAVDAYPGVQVHGVQAEVVPVPRVL